MYWLYWLVMLVSLIGEAAAAPPFMWRCADGSFAGDSLGYPCKPSEFVGKFWLSCLDGHSDCVTSETAFLGFDPKTDSPLRGHGYCYTSQPYTCSPDGKIP